MYVRVMEIDYWAKTVAKRASYDEAKGEWTVLVEREGREIALRPKQLVFATGMSAKPNLPHFKGMERFAGNSIIPRNTPVPTLSRAGKSSSSARTIPPTTFAPRSTRRAST